MKTQNMKTQDYLAIKQKLESWIKEVAGDKGVVIGLSGGIDSSVSCILAKNALGSGKVKGIILENSKFSREVGISQAEKFAKDNDIEIQKINIAEIREKILNTLPINKEEIIPVATLDVRLCDLYLRTVAFLENKIYLGTINSTERLCGWFPKGALVGDFDLLGGLLKEQIKGLAKEMNLQHLIPSVSQEAKDICSGCGYLPEFEGIPYQTLDEALFILETSATEEEIASKLRDKNISTETFKTIEKRVNKMKHKMDVFPAYCKINFK